MFVNASFQLSHKFSAGLKTKPLVRYEWNIIYIRHSKISMFNMSCDLYGKMRYPVVTLGFLFDVSEMVTNGR